MDTKNKLKELNREALVKVENYMKEKEVKDQRITMKKFTAQKKNGRWPGIN